MNMNDSLVTCRQQLFLIRQLQNCEDCLELLRLNAVVQVVAYDVSAFDLVLLETLDAQLDVLSCQGVRKPFVLCIEDLSHSKLFSLGQQSDRLILDQNPWLNLTIYEHVSDIFEFVDDWQSQRSFDVSFRQFYFFQGSKKVLTLVPTVFEWPMDVHVTDWIDWNKFTFWITAGIGQKGFNQAFDLIESVLWPIDCAHFGNCHDDWSYSKWFGKESVLSCLSLLNKTWLELTRFCGYDQNSDIRLTGTHDHVGDEVLVTWSVNEGEPSLAEWKQEFGILNRNSLHSFGWIDVWNSCQLPSLHVIILCLLFCSKPLLFIHFVELF